MSYTRRTDEDKINPYRWMTTYTDLVTLLLTFFVLLLSLAVVIEEKRVVAIGSVTGAFGVHPGAHSIIGNPKGANITVASAPMKAEEADLDMLTNIELKNSIETDMSVVKEEERLIISLGNRLLFPPRSSRIDPERVALLSEMKEVFKRSPARIELRGYADPSDTFLDPDPLRPAMMLSTKRAFSVFEFLTAGGEIPPQRIVAHGFGHTPSRTPAPKEQDQQSRQVEIILDYREKLPYRLSKPASSSFLDFKGFFFRLYGRENG